MINCPICKSKLKQYIGCECGVISECLNCGWKRKLIQRMPKLKDDKNIIWKK